MTSLFDAGGVTQEGPRPLADRLRPQRLEDVVGQEHLVGPEGTLTRMMAASRIPSLIFWGPPGTGKTTMARLLAGSTGLVFEQMSAIFSGVADLKKAFEQARMRRCRHGEWQRARSQDTDQMFDHQTMFFAFFGGNFNSAF